MQRRLLGMAQGPAPRLCDVRCASPESRLDEVEDLSAMGGDEDGGGATAEGAEVVEEDIEGDGGVYTPLHCGAGRPAF